ncbi:hypothetical protein BH24ACI1_BH24ACI1_28590 [soil metagenome]|nr:hypothetical protein [Pyrinomonadaceae bacterium]
MRFFNFVIISIFFISCSSSSTVETNVNSNNSDIAVVRKVNANVEVQADANSYPIQNMAVSKQNVRNWGAKRGRATDVAPIEATPMAYPAPDNSEISSTMNNNVPTEIRTFKNNPMLVKMERIFVDVKNPQIKVYLKNGKVVNVPPGKISNPATVSADEILSAAGVAPKPATQKVGEKMEQKEQ